MKIPRHVDPLKSDGLIAESQDSLSSAIQVCVHVIHLTLDAAMLSLGSGSKVRVNGKFRFRALPSLRLLLWDLETFCAENDRECEQEVYSEKKKVWFLTWTGLVKALTKGSPNLRTLRLSTPEKIPMGLLGTLCRGQLNLPRTKFIFGKLGDMEVEDERLTGMMDGDEDNAWTQYSYDVGSSNSDNSTSDSDGSDDDNSTSDEDHDG